MKSEDCTVCDNSMSSWSNSMFDGFAAHEIVINANDRPVNYTYLEVNDAFKRMMKLEGIQIVGKTATDIYISEEDIMLDAFAYVALEGKPLQFEHYFKTFLVDMVRMSLLLYNLLLRIKKMLRNLPEES